MDNEYFKRICGSPDKRSPPGIRARNSRTGQSCRWVDSPQHIHGKYEDINRNGGRVTLSHKSKNKKKTTFHASMLGDAFIHIQRCYKPKLLISESDQKAKQIKSLVGKVIFA